MKSTFINNLLLVAAAGAVLYAPAVVRADFFDQFDSLKERLEDMANDPEAAGSASITNTVDISANSGGQKTEGGSVTTGDARAHVKIQNTVNGEDIEPVDISVSSDSGTSTIDKKVEARGVVSEVHVEVSGNAEAEAEISIEGSGDTDSGQTGEGAIPSESGIGDIETQVLQNEAQNSNAAVRAGMAARISEQKNIIERTLALIKKSIQYVISYFKI